MATYAYLHDFDPRLRMKPPSFRHGAPSGPWPFLDLQDEVDRSQLSSPPPQPNPDYDHDEELQRQQNEERPPLERQIAGSVHVPQWSGYPQLQFGNWTPLQQRKSGISSLVERKPALLESCSVYQIDICEDGTFHDTHEGGAMVVKSGDPTSGEVQQTTEEFWESLQELPSPKVKVRALFVDHLSGPVLQMLGTKFHIEPFFFSSSLKCIPSRYQEQVQPGKGDHITITLRFIRILEDPSTMPSTPASSVTNSSEEDDNMTSSFIPEHAIDIEGPLILRNGKKLLTDLLAFHIVRRNGNSSLPKTPPPPSETESSKPEKRPTLDVHHHRQLSTASGLSSGGVSTIISYHRPSVAPYVMTSAKMLHERLLAAGRSVYWSNIFGDTVPSGDPNFVALSLLWYAMYSWDEVFESLLGEVAWLESRTLSTIPSDDNPNEDSHSQIHSFTHQLHGIRAHLLHYESLLSSFRKSVLFLRDTRNPAYTGKTGLAEFGEYNSAMQALAFETPKRRRTSMRRGGYGYASYGSIGSMGSFRRRSSNSDQERDRFRQTVGMAPLSPAGSAAGILSESISEEPESIDEDFFELMEKAETEEEKREVLLRKECQNLINEIDRLEMSRDMLDKRLGNVMALAFSSVNIEDSRRMRRLAERSGRDSAVMKQISYLTMVFLPATFMATIFGMNVKEINPGSLGTIPHYFAAVVPLTAVTIWIMMLQYHQDQQRKHDTITPSSIIRVAPTSTIRRIWNNMIWPLEVFIAELWPGRSGRSRRSKKTDLTIEDIRESGESEHVEKIEDERRESVIANSTRSLRTRLSRVSWATAPTHDQEGLPMEMPVIDASAQGKA